MKQITEEAFESYGEAMAERFDCAEVYDFMRCVRKDGSHYGTGGQCRIGGRAPDKEEEPKKQRAAKAPKKTYSKEEKKAVQARVKDLDKQAKAANKEADKLDAQWRKGGMKDKALQKQVKETSARAKDLDKQANKADKAWRKM